MALEPATPMGSTPFDRTARAALPVATSAMLIFLANLPILPAIGIPATPNIALMSVYFWRMTAPATMPPSAIFMLGFLSDGLSGAPLGLTSLALLFATGIVGLLRSSIHLVPFGFYYLGLLAALMAAELCGWITASLYYGHAIAAEPLAVRIVMSAFLYLPLAFALALLAYRFVIVPSAENREKNRKSRKPSPNAHPRTSEAGRAREVRRR
ncbi:MAG: hypothetical protein ACPG06_04455 [Alphaproteobacteria bacterium]